MADPFTRLRKFIDLALAFLRRRRANVRSFFANVFRYFSGSSAQPTEDPDVLTSPTVEGAVISTVPVVEDDERYNARRDPTTSAQSPAYAIDRPLDLTAIHDQSHSLTATTTDDKPTDPAVRTREDVSPVNRTAAHAGVFRAHTHLSSESSAHLAFDSAHPGFEPGLAATHGQNAGGDEPTDLGLIPVEWVTTAAEAAHPHDGPGCGHRRIDSSANPAEPGLETGLTANHDIPVEWVTTAAEAAHPHDSPVCGHRCIDSSAHSAINPTEPGLETGLTANHDQNSTHTTIATDGDPNGTALVSEQAIPLAGGTTTPAGISHCHDHPLLGHQPITSGVDSAVDLTHHDLEGRLRSAYPRANTTVGDRASDLPTIFEHDILPAEPTGTHASVSHPEPRPTPRPTSVSQAGPAPSLRPYNPSFPASPLEFVASTSSEGTTPTSPFSSKKGTSTAATTPSGTPTVLPADMQPSTQPTPRKKALLIAIENVAAADAAAVEQDKAVAVERDKAVAVERDKAVAVERDKAVAAAERRLAAAEQDRVAAWQDHAVEDQAGTVVADDAAKRDKDLTSAEPAAQPETSTQSEPTGPWSDCEKWKELLIGGDCPYVSSDDLLPT
jgi:hypothetical protein